jgi:OOP family OmpA-OmpF porin
MRALLATTALSLAALASAPAASPTVTGTFDEDVAAVRDATYGDDFAGHLAADYRDLALFEADVMVDWIDAEWFAQRAQRAGTGDVPAPADPEEWWIESERRMEELRAARAALVGVLNGGAADIAPERMATTQAAYDCWVEQQEEGWQETHIALCRNQFLVAARDLGAALRPTAPDLAGMLFFDFDESDLTPAAREGLAAIAEDLKAENPDDIIVVGHADTVGTDAYNEALSRARAKTVASTLRRMGVPDVSVETEVRVIADGETDPLVETGEGVRLRLNRRVALYEDEPEVGIVTR